MSLTVSLLKDGIDARIAELRKNLNEAQPDWIDRMIRESRFVLVVCDEHYQNSRHGAFVKRYITNHVFTQNGNKKYIPILVNHKNTEPDRDIPIVLRGYTYYDFRKRDAASQNKESKEHIFKRLVNRLLGKKEKKAPPLGKKPSLPPLKKAGSLF